MGFRYDSVQDGINDSWFIQVSMPFAYGQLGDDDAADSYRSSRICRSNSLTGWVMGCSPKSSRMMRSAFFIRSSHLMMEPSALARAICSQSRFMLKYKVLCPTVHAWLPKALASLLYPHSVGVVQGSSSSRLMG